MDGIIPSTGNLVEERIELQKELFFYHRLVANAPNELQRKIFEGDIKNIEARIHELDVLLGM